MRRRGGLLRRGGTSLVELVVAAPIGAAATALGIAIAVVVAGRAAAAAADPVLRAPAALETLRREIREARTIVYPRRGEVDVGARELVLRTRDGELACWLVERGALCRVSLPGGARRTVWPGVRAMAVRRLCGNRPLIRVGLARDGRAPVVLSAAMLASLGEGP